MEFINSTDHLLNDLKQTYINLMFMHNFNCVKYEKETLMITTNVVLV